MKGDSVKKKGFFLYGVDPVLLALSEEYAKEEREKSDTSSEGPKGVKCPGSSRVSSLSKKKRH